MVDFFIRVIGPPYEEAIIDPLIVPLRKAQLRNTLEGENVK